MEIKDLKKENEISLGALGMGVQQIGSGGITEETDPTVPQWAKEPNKPTYTYDEITEKPTLVEEIDSSIEEDTNELMIELKDKNGNVLATSKVKLPSTQINVDTELSGTSTNPVENQVVTKALGEKINMPQSISNKRVVVLTANNGAVEGIAVQIRATSGIFGNVPVYWNPAFDNAEEEASSTMGALTTRNPTKALHCVNLDYFNKNKGTKWYKHNIFVNVQNVTYFNMQIITTSQTEITYNGNGLVIQGAVIGNMYYGTSGSPTNELQQVGILLPFAETYYPTMIVFGSSGLPEIKNFLGGIFPSEVTEFIDTPTEL